MGPDVAPVSIKAIFPASSTSAQHLKDATRDSEASVGGDDFDVCHCSRNLATTLGSDDGAS